MNAQGSAPRLARLELALRSDRRSFFGPVVSSPDGWDIVLVLYLADVDGRRLTARQVLDEIGGFGESGKRRLSHLNHAGVVIGDGAGRLEDVVTLAPEALTKVEDMMEHAWSVIQAG